MECNGFPRGSARKCRALGRFGYRGWPVSPLGELISRLDAVMPVHRRELRARLGGLEKKFRDGATPDPRALRVVEEAIARSAAERERRHGLVPTVTYPADLPVTGALDQLRAAITGSQVVVVAGETGSGKSTQLPKLCLELGRGVVGRIAHHHPCCKCTVRHGHQGGIFTPTAQATGLALGRRICQRFPR